MIDFGYAIAGLGVILLVGGAVASALMNSAKPRRVQCPRCGRRAEQLCRHAAPEWYHCEFCRHWWESPNP